MSQPEPRYTIDRIIGILITVGIILGLYFTLSSLSTVLVPFFLAWLVAYVMEPIVSFIERFVKRRALAVFMTLIGGFVLFSGLMILLIPTLVNEVLHLQALVSSEVSQMHWPSWIPPDILDQVQVYLSNFDVSLLVQQEGFADKAFAALSKTWDAASGVFGALGALFGVVTFLLYLVFIMIDYKRLAEGWKAYLPEKYKTFVLDLVEDLDEGMNGYFRAQTKIVLAVAILFAIGFKLIGLPFGIVLGIFVGLLNYVPYLQTMGLIPALGLAGLNSLETGDSFWIMAALVLVIFAVVQVLQDAVLTPRIMGNLTGLNPAVILLSLSIWGSLLGMVGLIIAIPISTLLIAYYNRYIMKVQEAEK